MVTITRAERSRKGSGRNNGGIKLEGVEHECDRGDKCRNWSVTRLMVDGKVAGTVA